VSGEINFTEKGGWSP